MGNLNVGFCGIIRTKIVQKDILDMNNSWQYEKKTKKCVEFTYKRKKSVE